LKDYQDRLNGFRDVGEPVKKRHWYYTEINPVLESYDTQSKHAIKRGGEIEHLTDE